MKLGELTWAEVEELEKDKIVVLPFGSFEQHGRHLPLLTDTMIVTAIAERVEAAHPETVLLLPTLWLGYSPHHIGFPGTLTAAPNTYIDLLCQILEPMIELGFRKILVLNGHGGNECPLRMAFREVKHRLKSPEGLWLAAMSDWSAAPEMLHACEYETSLMLHLHPDLVQMDEAEAKLKPFHSEFYSFDFHRPDIVTVDYSFKEITKTGALGHPEQASAEMGETLLQKMVEETCRFVEEFLTW